LFLKWCHLERDGLNLSWVQLFPKAECRNLFIRLEEEVVYFTGQLATVKVFGKIHKVPRKQSGKSCLHILHWSASYCQGLGKAHNMPRKL
jgi:hypothetical protein